MSNDWKREGLSKYHALRKKGLAKMGVRNAGANALGLYIASRYVYDPISGAVSNLAGKQVGANGKLSVSVDDKLSTLRTSRVAWFLFYGSWPDYDVVPVDGNPLNTRQPNLVQQKRLGRPTKG